MGTVSGPFLIIRNLSVVFDDDDTCAFPPDLLDEEEDEVGGFLGLKAEERTQEHEDGQKRKPVVSIGFHCED